MLDQLPVSATVTPQPDSALAALCFAFIPIMVTVWWLKWWKGGWALTAIALLVAVTALLIYSNLYRVWFLMNLEGGTLRMTQKYAFFGDYPFWKWDLVEFGIASAVSLSVSFFLMYRARHNRAGRDHEPRKGATLP